jgi:type II secretory pathway pseudopilin PulG
MDYQIKFKNKIKGNKNISNVVGFTLIELLVVVGIFVALIVVSDSVYTNLKSSSNLKIATGSLVQAVRYAEENTQSGRGDSKWGVKILSDKVVVFKGNSYASRDVSSDQNLDFPGGIVPSGSSEFVFEKMTGWTTTTGTATITNNSGSKNISINAKGVITY